jgi:hypothetical protein
VYRSKQPEAAAASAASPDIARPGVLQFASPATAAPRTRAARLSEDEFLAHYFRLIDPAVAASFTKEQRRAIRAMFGDRGVTRHAIDIRCTFPLGWRRCYLVFLLGRDRRKRIRPRNGLPGDVGDWLAYLVMSLGLLTALFVLLSMVKI